MKQPLAEVFGFPIDNMSDDAKRHRDNKLCPYNNKVPNCTKDKAKDPLGVCSVLDDERPVVTCPVRFREDWIIAEDAAGFFFPEGTTWTSLTEIRLHDAGGQSAGNIDLVLVAYDDEGRIIDFGSCEVQAVYISGNVREPFAHYMEDSEGRQTFNWRGPNYPRPDYLSSSRKRLAPQLLFKGGIIHGWGKKQAVVVDRPFFETLPTLAHVEREEAELAWLIYDLKHDAGVNGFTLTRDEVVYTKFEPAMLKVTKAEPGPVEDFVSHLQSRLDVHLQAGAPAVMDVALADNNAPVAPALSDIIQTDPEDV